jgi:hypothetical protein
MIQQLHSLKLKNNNPQYRCPFDGQTQLTTVEEVIKQSDVIIAAPISYKEALSPPKNIFEGKKIPAVKDFT